MFRYPVLGYFIASSNARDLDRRGIRPGWFMMSIYWFLTACMVGLIGCFVVFFGGAALYGLGLIN